METNGDGVNHGDADPGGTFESGEQLVDSWGFGSGSGDRLPFDPAELGG